MNKSPLEEHINSQELPHTNHHGFLVYGQGGHQQGIKSLVKLEYFLILAMFLAGALVASQNIWQFFGFVLSFLFVVYLIYKLYQKLTRHGK